MSLQRYIYGWFMFCRAVRLARAKKRGAGKMPWGNALKMGAAYRFIVDGQNCRPPRFPRYLRSILLLAFLLVGCGEQAWVRDQYEYCYKRGGTGDYSRVTLMFVCWERTEPPSRKKKLYELRYR